MIFGLLFSFFVCEKCLASAWVVEKGKTRFILQNFNTHGNLNGNRYNGDKTPIYIDQSSINGYFEYGIFNKMSIGSNFMFSNKRVDDKVFGNNVVKNNFDLFEVFFKSQIMKTKSTIFSMSQTVGVPVYKEYTLHNTQAPYKPNWSFEQRVMFGIGAEKGNFVDSIIGGSGSFLNFELGYKINSNGYSYSDLASNFDEIKSQIDLGYAIKDENVKMLLLQIFKTNRIYKVFNDEIGISKNGFRDNDINQFLGSVLLDIGSDMLFQFGVFYEVRNTILGKSEEGNFTKGIVLGLWA